MGIRYQEPLPPSKRKQASTCQRKDCAQSTAGNKPFCSTHVRDNPYASKLMSELEELRRYDGRKFRPLLTSLTTLIQWGSAEGLNLKQRRDWENLIRLVELGAAETVRGGRRQREWVIRPTPLGEVVYWERCTTHRGGRPRKKAN